ncbi:MAG: hypothetical protein L6Q95_17655 [Planctomycetes bacterium]|nr:hypothetical protein [Planctomycetota bacterium]
MPAHAGFVARLRRRWEIWWGHPFRWGSWRSYGDAVHRLRERYTLRRAEDPDAAWRCCAHWQRSLVSKWNGREFARKHGARVPDLYWIGRRPSRIPFDALPARFVIRPVGGSFRMGIHVVVDGRELLRRDKASTTDLRARLRRGSGRLPLTPLIVEQFVARGEGDDRLPLEYKFHTFAGAVAAIQAVERTDTDTACMRYYTPRWEPFEDVMDTARPPSDLRDPPGCLPEMLDLARRLGKEIGTYMRIDFFATDRGCVFNEFASTPSIREPKFTPFCDDLFGTFWREKCPDAS